MPKNCIYCSDYPGTTVCYHDSVDGRKGVPLCETCHQVVWGGDFCELEVLGARADIDLKAIEADN